MMRRMRNVGDTIEIGLSNVTSTVAPDEQGPVRYRAPRAFDPRCIVSTVDRYGSLDRYGSRPLNADDWSQLSELGWLSVTGDTGQETDVSENGVARILGIENYFNSGRFRCVIRPHSSIAARWETLATSKYGDPVAGVIVPGQDANDGLIFVPASSRAPH